MKGAIMYSLRQLLEDLAPSTGHPYSLRAAHRHLLVCGVDQALLSSTRRVIKLIVADRIARVRGLWYNTMLLRPFNVRELFPAPIKPALPDLFVKAKPAVNQRAEEIGSSLRGSDYDVVLLSEVWEEAHQGVVTSKLRGTYQPLKGPGSTTLTLDKAILDKYLAEIPSLEFAGELASAIRGAIDNAFDFLTFGVWTEVREQVLPTVTIGSSGLLALSRFEVLDHVKVAFDEKGNIFRDADAWSNKGINAFVVRVPTADGSLARLMYFSAHLYNGGWGTDPDDTAKWNHQQKQLVQLCGVIDTMIKKYPTVPFIIAGDTNVAGDGPFANHLDSILDMHHTGRSMDVWESISWLCYQAHHGGTSHPENPAICPLGTSAGGMDYCDDEMRSAASPPDNVNRIDYFAVSRYQPQHEVRVIPARPRRRAFHREPGAFKFDEQQFMSDHIALEVDLLLLPKHVLAAPSKG